MNRIQGKYTSMLVGLLFFLYAFLFLYIVWGHQLIAAMYTQQLGGILNQIIESQQAHSLAYYYQEADWCVFILTTFLSIGLLLLYSACLGKKKIVFYGIIMAHMLYCVIMIIKLSVIIDGVRYFTLFDDAMISMRYAKHLAMGYGLVWNPGDTPVEGYTNFLWVLYMALWHMLPISSAKIALPIQITGMFLLTGTLVLVKKITDYIGNNNTSFSITAVLLTASYLPINFLAVKGMETSIIGFLVLLIIWRLVHYGENRSYDIWFFVLCGVGLLVRIDFMVLYVFFGVYLFLIDDIHRRMNVILWVLVGIIVMGGMTLFRRVYYHDILPNTYYLKMSGIPLLLRLQKGLWIAYEYIKKMSVVIFILPFVYYLFRQRDKRIALLMLTFVCQFFYSIYVGGDIFEWWHLANRYITIVMPCFFIVLSLMVGSLIEKGLLFAPKQRMERGSLFRKVCSACVIAVLIFQIHGGFSRPYFEPHMQMLRIWGYIEENDRRLVRVGLRIKEITTAEALLAVTWAGALPYFAERYSIDVLGKSDAYIAHQKAKVHQYRDFLPGHNKYDYGYSIIRLKPDVIQELRFSKEDTKHTVYKNYINNYYLPYTIEGESLWLRRNSPAIRWDRCMMQEPSDGKER